MLKQATYPPPLTCRPPASAFSYMAACCSSAAFERSSARRARPHSWLTQGQLRTARAYTALMTAGQAGEARLGEFGVQIASDNCSQAVRQSGPSPQAPRTPENRQRAAWSAAHLSRS